MTSEYELAKVFSNQDLSENPLMPITDELIEENICARRKLNLILRSHSYDRENVKTGDLVKVYLKGQI